MAAKTIDMVKAIGIATIIQLAKTIKIAGALDLSPIGADYKVPAIETAGIVSGPGPFLLEFC